MTGVDQGVAWAVFFGLVVIARLLTTRVAVRYLRPRLQRLVDWWMARPRPQSEADAEFEELWAVLRRQQLTDAVERLRRILATDESMSATRQIANRLAYRRLLYDLQRIPDVLPDMPHDDRLISRSQSWRPDPRSDSIVEILEIGRRR